MLTNLKLTNFRIHKSTEIDFNNNKFVALVGKNDIGKSSVLEALDILCNSGKTISEDDKTKGSTDSANIICTFDGRILNYASPTIEEDRKAINAHFYKFGVDDNNHFIDLNQNLKSLISLWNSNCREFIEVTYPYHYERERIEDLLNIFTNLHKLKTITTSQQIKDFINEYMSGNRDLQKIIAKKSLLNSLSKNEEEKTLLNNIFSILSQFETNILQVLKCKGLTKSAKNIIREFSDKGDSNLLNSIGEIKLEQIYKNDTYSRYERSKPYYILWIPEESADPDIEIEWETFKKQINNTFLNGSTQINNIPFFNRPEHVDLSDIIFDGSLEDIINKSEEIWTRFNQYSHSENEKDIVYLWGKFLDSFGSNDIKLAKRGSGFKRLCEIYAFTMNNLAEYSIANDTIIFAVEEPEISLHPSQQRDIVQRLKDILRLHNTQVIISTHSPIIVKEMDTKTDCVRVLTKDGVENLTGRRKKRIVHYDSSGKDDGYISINEINYIAFDEPSIEYHIELFGYIHDRAKLTSPTDISSIGAFDNWLTDEQVDPFLRLDENGTNDGFVDASNKLVKKTNCWRWVGNSGGHRDGERVSSTLPVCVRNNIDHPHQDNNYFNDKVGRSIELMRSVIENDTTTFPIPII